MPLVPPPARPTPSLTSQPVEQACQQVIRAAPDQYLGAKYGPARQAPVIGESQTSPSISPLAARVDALRRVTPAQKSEQRKLGVLLTSHGDIDDPKTELREYVRQAVLKNSGIPLPGWLRPAIDALGWPLEKKTLFAQYDQIGPTHYDANSQEQAQAVTTALRGMGIKAKTYVGYNFSPPMIDETLQQMKADGITDIVVFNQGAQNSIATMGESIEEVKEALVHHQDWQVKVSAVCEYNDEQAFVELLGDRLVESVRTSFPGAKPQDVLVLVASHGLPQHLIDKGDTAPAAMLRSFEKLQTRLSSQGYQIEHGFLNDDFFPGAKWTGPDLEERVEQILEEVSQGLRPAPKYVLLDGRLSFTVHHRATLYDANTVVRDILENPPAKYRDSFPGAKVVLAPNFDADPRLARLIAGLTKSALAGQGEHYSAVADQSSK